MTAAATSTKNTSTSDELAGVEDLRRLYKLAYKAGVPIEAELQLELETTCVLGGVVPISACGRYWFDADAAARVVEFFREYLVHIKGELAGKPLDPMEWEVERILRPLFGWKRWDGTRRYRRAWIEVPRKNDKTTLAAGISLYLTFADAEPGAEVYAAAADKEQAAICFDIAKAMIESSAPLLERCEVFRRSIVVPATFTKYQVLSADAFTKHGLNAHGIVVDEVHAQRTRELIDVLHTSTSSRRQPLEVHITTAGYDKHSICYEMHEHALKVEEWNESGGEHGMQDDELLVVIYAARPEDDWKSEEVWHKANPGLGRSKKLDYMRSECRRAQQIPSYENTFKRLELNLWTEQASRWLAMDRWDLCVGPIADAIALRKAMLGQKCWGGLDLANTIDINALVLAFLPGGKRLVWLPFFWIPEEKLRERQERDQVPWALWVKHGLVKVMPGAAADYDVIRSDIETFSKQYILEELGIDRWNALQIATQLENGPAARLAKSRDPKREHFVIGFGQGFASMTTPCKAIEAAVVAGRLEHAGHPVLRWMASNVAAQRDAADNVKIDKEASSEKVDGMVAGAMATGRALVYQPQGTIDGWLNNPVMVG